MENNADNLEFLVTRCISQKAAEVEIDGEINEDFLNKGQHCHTVDFSLPTWCFGYVRT